MKTQLDKIKSNLATLDAFVSKYELPLPENLVTMTCTYGCIVTVHATLAPDQAGRDKVLATVGEAFGRDGWTAKFDNYSRNYNWRKDMDGVSINIDGAEKSTMPESFSVPPQKFPIMLEDQPA